MPTSSTADTGGPNVSKTCSLRHDEHGAVWLALLCKHLPFGCLDGDHGPCQLEDQVHVALLQHHQLLDFRQDLPQELHILVCDLLVIIKAACMLSSVSRNRRRELHLHVHRMRKGTAL